MTYSAGLAGPRDGFGTQRNPPGLAGPGRIPQPQMPRGESCASAPQLEHLNVRSRFAMRPKQ